MTPDELLRQPLAVQRAALQAVRLERMHQAVQDSTVALAKARSRKYQPGTFHRQLGAACDWMVDGAIRGLSPWAVWEAPPRHGKTEQVGRTMPARAMALQPGFSVLYMTSTSQRAREVSNTVRRWCEFASQHPKYRHLAPGTPWTETEWTTAGGNSWFGLGIETSTGGIGCHLVVFDDVTGSAKRARSQAFRDSAWRAIEEDGLSRVMDGGGAVFMETRRHVDDMSGRARSRYGGRLRIDTWRLVAEAGDTDGRAPGEYLWPEKYGADWHEANPQVRGLLYDQLYQQRPHAEGGELVSRDAFRHRYAGTPEAAREACDLVVIAADTAHRAKRGNDATAFVVIGRQASGRYLVLDVVAERLPYSQQRSRLRDLATKWRADAVVVEGRATGDSLVDDLREVIPGIQTVDPDGDKVRRALPVLPVLEAGQVWLPESAPWVLDFIDEVCSVPPTGDAVHDDQFDALVYALRYLLDLARDPGAAARAAFYDEIGGW